MKTTIPNDPEQRPALFAWLRSRSFARFISLGLCVLVLPLSLSAAPKKAKKAARPKVPPGKPEIFQLEPRGIQRGVPSIIKLSGTNLFHLTQVTLFNDKLQAKLLERPETGTNVAWIEVTPAADMPRGAYDLAVKSGEAESSKLKLYVDDLPQVYEPGNKEPGQAAVLNLPASFWGTFAPGESDEVLFDAKAGESLMFDVAAKSIASKANAMLAILDETGRLLASNSGFDGGDPLLNFRVPAPGRYRLRLSERTGAGSSDHYYRVSVGEFAVVVGGFPLGVPANQESSIELVGFNLPPDSRVPLRATDGPEMQVPLDPEKFRTRGNLKVVVNQELEEVEREPNNTVEQAARIPLPAAINGRIWPPSPQSVDVDLFRFEAKAGQVVVIETSARQSPIDTKIEVLHTDGKPVEKLLLQAVRDSHLTFRAIDSMTDDLRVENWQEMELNQWMYLQGEVCRIFRMPQGPDSGFQFYNNRGKRRDYFGTSPIAHPLDEPLYIVEPHRPGTKLIPNGLPVFTLYYENDDDPDRELGNDSRLLFTAPADAPYLVRVSDTRGQGGPRFSYRLIVREAKPDFKVTLNGANPTINAGSGKEFSVNVDRIDGFDDDIRIDVSGVPAGFAVSTPVVVQAGHLDAKGCLNAAPDAQTFMATNSEAIALKASAVIKGQTVTRDVNSLGNIKVAEAPKLYVALEPYEASQTNFIERAVSDKPLEITIAPGESVPAWLKIKRNGFEELVTFSVEGLPHGVIVDNIGLNGVLIPKGQDLRQIFLTAAKWVPDIDRLCFAQAKQADNQTSLPLLIHVRRPSAHSVSSAQ
jgi:hypothetical protein